MFLLLAGPVTALVDGKVTLVGVSSFVLSKCIPNKPMGFASVTAHLDWILANTDAGEWQCHPK
jgi:hypothetical protein